MKKYFENATKVSLASLLGTIIVLLALWGLLKFAGSDAIVIQKFGKVFMAVALPFLMLNPIFGLIYSFFIKGRKKIVYIILHVACVCTISVFGFVTLMFRYFVPFAP